MINLPLNVDFTGKVVVVTGAGGVLCGEMAKAFAQAGAKVAVAFNGENVRNGGFGEQVASFVMEEGLSARVQIIALPNRFVHQGRVSSQMKETGIDADSVAGKILKVYKELEQKVRK